MANVNNIMVLAHLVKKVMKNNPKLKFFSKFLGPNDLINFFKAFVRLEEPNYEGIPKKALKYIETLETFAAQYVGRTDLVYARKGQVHYYKETDVMVDQKDTVEFIYGMAKALVGGEVWSEKEILDHAQGSTFFKERMESARVQTRIKIAENNRILKGGLTEENLEKVLEQRKIMEKMFS